MIHSPSLLRSRKALPNRTWFIPSGARVVMPVLIMVLFVAGTTRPHKSALLDTSGDWSVSGQNLSNTRYQAAEGTIGVNTVGNLAPKWSFTTGGNVTATPAVVAGAVYVPGWAGNLSKLDATTGAMIWSHSIGDYTGVAGAISRTSPAVSNNTVFVGTLTGADVVAVDATTGDLIWLKQLDTHPYAQITQSPVVYNGVVYVGVSSDEEHASTNSGYTCCTFRGSIAALDATTGRLIWQTYTVPPNDGQPGGYSGAAVWSSSPVVDADRNSLYITTGDNYSVPSSVSTCISQAGGASCNASNDYFDSILALDLTTGDAKWATKTVAADSWNWACRSGPRSNCPLPAGPDFDFGAGANLFQATINGHLQTVLGAGQKSGIYWAIDPDTGSLLWSTVVGPSGKIGGIEWGTATDGTRIYVAIANSHHDAYKLMPSGQTVTGGAWSALDPATGKLLWQTADPYNAVDVSAVTVANGVVYVAALDSVGHMYALDAATGVIRWTFASGGSVAAGPAISHGVVYWGSGYDKWGGTSSNTFYAFSIPAGLLTMSPTAGSVQQIISLSATQFGPSEAVSIHNDAVSSPALSTVTTTPNGSFQTSAAIPEATFGIHTLFAVGQSTGISAATTYSVQPLVVLTPATLSAGTTMTGSGFGFGSTEVVKLYWDTLARPLGTGHASTLDTFKDAAAVVFTVPQGAGKGTHKIIAIGQTSHAQTVIPVVVH